MFVEAGTRGLFCLLHGHRTPLEMELMIRSPSFLELKSPQRGNSWHASFPVFCSLADKGSSEKASSYQFWGSRWVPTFAYNAENTDGNNLSFFTGQRLQDKPRKYLFLSLRLLCLGPKAGQTSGFTDHLGCGVPISPLVAVRLLVSD